MLKGLSTGILAVGLSLTAMAAHANGVSKVFGCATANTQKVCTDLGAQATYAGYVARSLAQKALSGGLVAPINIIIQSDNLDKAMHYRYEAMQDTMVIEGERGEGIYMPYTSVRLVTAKALAGNDKDAVMQLVSPKTAVKNFANQINYQGELPKGGFGYEEFCNYGEPHDRNPNHIKANCWRAMQLKGYWSNAKNTTTHLNRLQTNGTVGFEVELNALLANSKVTGEGSSLQEGMTSEVLKFGAPVFFVTVEGYHITFSPQVNGQFDMTGLVIPPGIIVPVDKDGNITEAQAIDTFLSSKHTVDKLALAYIKHLNHRFNNIHLRRLARYLEETGTVECPLCKATDLPKLPTE
ncbi:hypothetical protein [Psychrobium sp. 1_MG-2023]|uniref:hypothetical protein n=1 Tax=Psychrobium sp. 1_MG-2023 TaxID=3062624 RepID=UPI000C33269E|nr:hypothetical protein [Psychrobium sp. 1_MG-2023]MDP2561080.1 hypothetical protein [Psychrobium sp. 1_MG-2023]PKF58369.1 hypothetical protein CW748_04200 [Alteromonadales bacterium alter-6D02]